MYNTFSWSFGYSRGSSTNSKIVILGRASLGPRIVYLRAFALEDGFSNRIWSNKTVDDKTFFDNNELGPEPPHRLVFKSHSTVPILYACRESRAVATKIYTLAFGTSPYPCTWFDFSNDTLYLDWEISNDYTTRYIDYGLCYSHSDLGRDARKVVNLAVNDGLAFIGSPWEITDLEDADRILGILEWFSAMKYLKVVCGGHETEDDLVEMDGFHPIYADLEIFEEMAEYSIEVEEDRSFQESVHTSFSKAIAGAYARTIQRLQDDVERTINIPTISHKTITTRKMRDEYIPARKLYDAERELHGTTITVLSTEQEASYLAVQQTWTLNEVIARYRKAANISRNWKYEHTTCPDVKGILCPESTVHDLGLKSGSVLTVEFGLRRSQRISRT
jgi:hypothetical protein